MFGLYRTSVYSGFSLDRLHCTWLYNVIVLVYKVKINTPFFLGQSFCILIYIYPLCNQLLSGADPGFQVRGGALKKLCQAERGTKYLGVFHVKNHDFMPKNLIFSNFRGSVCRVRPPPGSAPDICMHQT